jgi:class 3 adenylate cyclase
MLSIKNILISSSEQRLEMLIKERMKPDADKEVVDKRIWDLFGEKWAVMFTDLSGFSRKVAKFGIIHFLQIIYESERILIPVVDEHDGILLKTEGDSLLIIFRNIEKSVECAVEMQKVLEKYNIDKVEEEKIFLCLGLGYGDMLRIGDSDVFGAEVNAASKLGEDIAGPSEILITEAIKKHIEGKFDFSFEELKEVPPGAKKAYKLIY